MFRALLPRRRPPAAHTSPWLGIAAPLGKVAAIFLLLENFLLLLAPLAFLLGGSGAIDPGTANGLVVLLADPGYLLAISVLIAVIGISILASALFLVLLGLFRGDRKVSFDALLAGIASFVCLVAWVPLSLYAQARARGTVGSLDAAVASGGWTIASALLLVAAVAYLVFTLRLDNGSRPLKLTTLWWPLYAAVNVLGTSVLAGFFGGGASNLDAFSLGLTLKISLIPMLGLLAYRDLRDKWPLWANLGLVAPPPEPSDEPQPVRKKVPAKARGQRAARPARRPRVVRPAPLPPPPDD